ncbi:hypothetical protein [Umezawaea tangerina]|uniref:YbaB/EbfC DNA-binding family protein n=1 Tax=Umezawaea tangerina TaxID=84725 RepID=A0A2T0T6L2_9PSEU|nr:hypothetical protein [Umezawaea tangerina]PRY41298.1 hypothetical protein CLV43_10556 [Umezawaea tangerina]
MRGLDDEFRERLLRSMRRNPAKALDDALARTREVTGAARSPDGRVEVAVDATGMLTRLDLGPSRHDEALARQISYAVLKASAGARAEVRNLYAGLVDAGVIDELPAWLPEPPPLPAAPPARRGPDPEEPPYELRSEDAW